MARPFNTKKYTVEELQEQMELYLKYCDEKEKPKTVSGLCVWLGVSKMYLADLKDCEDYSLTIKTFKSITENDVEEGILTGKYNATAGIFNLKNNYDWTDKQIVDNTNSFKFAFSDNPQIASENIKRLLSGS